MSNQTKKFVWVRNPVTREDRRSLTTLEALERWVYDHTKPKDAPSWRVLQAQREADAELAVARKSGGIGFRAMQDAEAARRVF